MLTKRSILLAKAEYLLGRELTADEHTLLIRRAGTGTQTKIKATLGIENNRRHLPVGIVIEKYIPKIDKLSTEQLIGIVNELTVKATSVDSGIRILRKALSKDRDGLIKYLINLWFRDSKNTDRYKKAYEGSYNMQQEYHYSQTDPYSRESGAIKTTQPIDMGNQANYELGIDGYPRDIDTGGNRAKNPVKPIPKEKKVTIEPKKKKEYLEFNENKSDDKGNVQTDNYNEVYDNTDIAKNYDK